MDNAEEVLQALEEFSKLKPKDIPKELDEYLGYVAKTGDPVYQWHLVKHLFHEKLATVIKDFYETSPTIDLPPCPNVDTFNYERLKTSLLERLDTFSSAPFTIQRICELLTNPRKQYNRVDKFMRAIEKNILVVSTREPGIVRRLENEQTEAVLNGIPESKLSESDDRTINVSSDNLQFNNSTDSTQITVENAANACVIQEEVEIANSESASTTVITNESKPWCGEGSENNKSAELGIKTDLVDNSEISANTTSSSVLPSTELPKNTNILFTDNEVKADEDVVKSEADNIVCDEPLSTSTPDSPDSPEPSSSEDLCRVDNLNDESMQPETSETESMQPETSETETSCDSVKENDNSEIITEEVENDSIVTETEYADKPLISGNNGEETLQIVAEEVDVPNSEDAGDELKTVEVSSEHKEPDSSNDSCENSDVNNGSNESSFDVQNEKVLPNEEEHVTKFSDSSTSEQNVLTEITDTTSSNQEDDGPTVELIVKEVDDDKNCVGTVEVENSVKTEEVECPVIEEATETVTNEEVDDSSTDNIIIQEVTDIKEEYVESATIVEHSEIVEGSNEGVDEFCEQQKRSEGSVIQATVNSSESESQVQSNMAAVEDICVDQTSCAAEDEAMDVDESSNQQMITSEGENEVEPMDQSDEHPQS